LSTVAAYFALVDISFANFFSTAGGVAVFLVAAPVVVVVVVVVPGEDLLEVGDFLGGIVSDISET